MTARRRTAERSKFKKRGDVVEFKAIAISDGYQGGVYIREGQSFTFRGGLNSRNELPHWVELQPGATVKVVKKAEDVQKDIDLRNGKEREADRRSSAKRQAGNKALKQALTTGKVAVVEDIEDEVNNHV